MHESKVQPPLIDRPCQLKKPFKGPRRRRGSCWEERKRIVFPDEGSLIYPPGFFTKREQKKIELVARPNGDMEFYQLQMVISHSSRFSVWLLPGPAQRGRISAKVAARLLHQLNAKSQDPVAQVLRDVQLPVQPQKHPPHRYEQPPTVSNKNAFKIWPQRINVQKKSKIYHKAPHFRFSTGALWVNAYFQFPGPEFQARLTNSFLCGFKKKLKAHFAQKTQPIGGYFRNHKKNSRNFHIQITVFHGGHIF